ncbi:MAG: flippase-like domain-containing protein [candidate division Zixibacteria bacterium]|nr:flippase-like domain-containing protein [candidate division Zixibacteria bacterium]
MDLIFDKKHIIKGFRLFILLSLLGFATIFFFTTTGESLKALQSFKAEFLLLAFFLVLVDFFLGGLRIYVFFTKEILKKIRLLDCVKANLANIFVAAVTPFNTGGGPAQLYILNRRGVPLSGAMSVGVINFFCSLFFFLLTFLVVFFFTDGGMFARGLAYLIRYSFLVFSVVCLAVAFMLIKPESLSFLFRIFSKITEMIWKKDKKKQKRILEKFKDQVVQLRFYLQHFFHKEKLILFASFLLTILLYFNKYLIAYVIIKGLGLDVNFMQVMYLQIIQFFILYFSPTPGASGIAEISSVSLMSTIIPTGYLPVFAVLWRFFVTYLGVTCGGWITLKDLNQHFKEKQMVLEKVAEEPQLAAS